MNPDIARAHLSSLVTSAAALESELPRLDRWGRSLARTLSAGGRLLVAGNGGSAAQAQHLTSELVGRYRSDRRPLSAIALHAESSSFTAIVNDFGPTQAFARQVLAHGRAGDVLLSLSTSGRSTNVLGATDAAKASGLTAWAMTGPAPNPLGDRCDDALTIASPVTATVQELHLVAIHLLCEVIDDTLDNDDQGHHDIAPISVSAVPASP